LGAIALLDMLNGSRSLATAAGASNPLAPKAAHHPPRAKSVIFLFMEGGPSHLDLFDPKPALEKLAGKPMPESFGRPLTSMGTVGNTIMPTKRQWAQHGQSGLWVSDWYPNVAKHADDLAVIRSCWADGLNHVGSVCQMNTGAIIAGRPSLGSWLTYGLGAANANLPTFVILTDNKSVVGGAQNWSSGFLPAAYQGTLLQREGPPILHLSRSEKIGAAQQRGMLDLLLDMNRHHAQSRPSDNELDARIESYELAYRMQSSAPEAVNIGEESEITRRMYGLDNPSTEAFGKNCLRAPFG